VAAAVTAAATSTIPPHFFTPDRLENPLDSDDLLARIRKLLDMAEATELTNEARDSYNAKAAQLIAKYGVDQALLEAASSTRPTATDKRITIPAPYARDKLGLLASIAVALGCKIVRRPTPQLGGGTLLTAHLIGMSADLTRAEILYTSLLVQMAHGLAAARVPFGEDARAYRRSWMAGFASTIAARLEAAERAARRDATSGEDGSSTALVLASRADLVSARLTALYPRLQSSPSRRLSGSGMAAGQRSGLAADLGGGSRLRPGGRRSQLD